MIGGGIRINEAARSGEVTFMLGAVNMNCRGLVDPQNKPFAQALGSASKNHVLGGVHAHQRQTKEGESRIQRVAQVRCDRLPTTPWRGSMVEPSDKAVTYAQEKWLSPLPPTI